MQKKWKKINNRILKEIRKSSRAICYQKVQPCEMRKDKSKRKGTHIFHQRINIYIYVYSFVRFHEQDITPEDATSIHICQNKGTRLDIQKTPWDVQKSLIVFCNQVRYTHRSVYCSVWSHLRILPHTYRQGNRF